jgi:hypothetical protein
VYSKRAAVSAACTPDSTGITRSRARLRIPGRREPPELRQDAEPAVVPLHDISEPIRDPLGDESMPWTRPAERTIRRIVEQVARRVPVGAGHPVRLICLPRARPQAESPPSTAPFASRRGNHYSTIARPSMVQWEHGRVP